MLVVISIIGKDLDNIDYTKDRIDIEAVLEKQINFNIDYFSLRSMQSSNNELQMTAGGSHYLMFMQQSNSDIIWSTSLCDFTSMQNDYICKPCKPKYFSPSFSNSRCIPCESISKYYFYLSQQETNKLLFLCGEFANQSGFLGISKIGLGVGLSIGLAILILIISCIFIRKRRLRRQEARP